MAGTGLGLPNVDSFKTYGGPVANYPIGVIDPTTEEDASIRNLYVANVAAMTHTIDRAVYSFLAPTGGNNGLLEPSSGFVHAAVWGTDASVKPVGTYVAIGTVDLIWPTQVTDALGQVHQVSLKRARATVESTTGAFVHASATVTTGNKIRVYTYAGSTLDDIWNYLAIVTVWVR